MFLFADDTNALAQNSNLNDLINFVNLELQKLAGWFKANKLAINVKKTKYMIFRTKNRTINLNGKDVYINFNEPNAIENPELIVKLSRVHNDGDQENQTIRVLGVLFDEYLNFNEHVLHVKRKLCQIKNLVFVQQGTNCSRSVIFMIVATIATMQQPLLVWGPYYGPNSRKLSRQTNI
jgi:hypothetical protein